MFVPIVCCAIRTGFGKSTRRRFRRRNCGRMRRKDLLIAACQRSISLRSSVGRRGKPYTASFRSSADKGLKPAGGCVKVRTEMPLGRSIRELIKFGNSSREYWASLFRFGLCAAVSILGRPVPRHSCRCILPRGSDRRSASSHPHK
jgi:hypothetical protein